MGIKLLRGVTRTRAVSRHRTGQSVATILGSAYGVVRDPWSDHPLFHAEGLSDAVWPADYKGDRNELA